MRQKKIVKSEKLKKINQAFSEAMKKSKGMSKEDKRKILKQEIEKVKERKEEKGV